MMTYDLLIIGAGPAGLLAGINAKRLGVKNILIIEKNPVLGGMLNSCDYKVFKELDRTGKDYLKHLLKQFEESEIETRTNTMALNISPEGAVVCTSPERGIEEYKAKKILLANGGKEKGRAPLNMPGDRVAGIYSLSTAKAIASEPGMCLGYNVVLFGTSHLDTIEKTFMDQKVKVRGIINPTGDPVNSPFAKEAEVYDGYTIAQILGEGRIEKLVLKKDRETKEISCDTLVFASGWLSDGIVAMRSGITLNPETTGAKVDRNFMTSRDQIFASGNGIFIHEYMDDIIEEAKHVAKAIIS